MKEKAFIDKICKPLKDAPAATLLNFQNGTLAAVSKETQFCRMVRAKDKAPAALVVAGGRVYHGLVGASTGDSLTDSYLCVRNKTTNKMRIIPIEQALLTNDIYNDLDQQQKPSRFTEDKAAHTLVKQFGGRKASRYLNNKEKMHINIDIVKDELEATVQEANVADAELEISSEKYLDSIRPKFNVDAKKEFEVYNLNDVIPAELLMRLDAEARQVLITKVDQLPIESEYLLECIQKLKSTIATEDNLTKVKMIIYMDCLQNLIKCRGRSLRNVELSGISEKLESDVRERFSDPTANALYSRTKYSTEKALCHFIVLALLISDDYAVDANVLTTELTTSRIQLLKYAQIVNARIKLHTDQIILRLPSKVPALSEFNRKLK